MKIDLYELQRKCHDTPAGICYSDADLYAPDPTCTVITLALIARIRDLEAFIAATPDVALQADKLHRDDWPELFTDDDGAALYMDEAKGRLLEKGAMLP